ncbi:MAG: GNAT family N-acetyltransferase [Methanobacteriaceae archaeon]|nr:GNAT family N-acetyltransferase [Methanobacteriaceae archaeon]
MKKTAQELMYHVLWAPHGMSKVNTREILEKDQINNNYYVAITNNPVDIIGCIVTREEGYKLEIKHLAVKEQFQRKGIGKSLVNHVLKESPSKNVKVIARNTSIIFWEKLGFNPCGKWIKHPLFTKHGIVFRKYCYNYNI